MSSLMEWRDDTESDILFFETEWIDTTESDRLCLRLMVPLLSCLVLAFEGDSEGWRERVGEPCLDATADSNGVLRAEPVTSGLRAIINFTLSADLRTSVAACFESPTIFASFMNITRSPTLSLPSALAMESGTIRFTYNHTRFTE